MIQNAIGVGNEILEATNIPVDTNEPTYCYCNGVAYGEMIKCDNAFVSVEHLGGEIRKRKENNEHSYKLSIKNICIHPYIYPQSHLHSHSQKLLF